MAVQTTSYNLTYDYVAATTVHTSSTSTAASVDTSAFRALGVTIGIIDIIIGSIGNFLTILAIAGNKKLHKPFHIFIANLCVIDFLTASTMMPFNVTAYYTGRWPFGEDDFTCTFMAYSYYSCGYTSIVCLVVITTNRDGRIHSISSVIARTPSFRFARFSEEMECEQFQKEWSESSNLCFGSNTGSKTMKLGTRFIGVVYPDDYEKLFTKSRIAIVILCSWIFAPAFLAPVFFFSKGGYGWAPILTLCVFLKPYYTPAEVNYMQFIRVLFQFLPLLIMATLYSKIFLTSKESGRAVKSLSVRSQNNIGAGDRLRTYSDFTRSSPAVRRLFRRPNPETSSSRFNDRGSKRCLTGSCQITITEAHGHHQPNDVPRDGVTHSSEFPPNPHLLNLSRAVAKSDPQLQNEEKAEEKISCHDHTSSLSLSPRLPTDYQSSPNAKSVSVPATPLLGVRKMSNSSRKSIDDSILSLSSTTNFDKQSIASQNRFSSQIFSRSRCSSKRSKYSSVIKMEERKRKRVDRRLLRISLTICVAFTILFLPSVIINLISVNVDPRLHMFASVITWFNSCVNPIIYSFMNSNMRKQYKLLLIKFWNTICRCTRIEMIERKSVLSSSSTRLSRREIS